MAAKQKRKSKQAHPKLKPWSRTATIELASCCSFALKYMDIEGNRPGGMVIDLSNGPNRGKTMDWRDKFFDALDGVGYEIDRKAYHKQRDERLAKKRRRR